MLVRVSLIAEVLPLPVVGVIPAPDALDQVNDEPATLLVIV